MDYKDIFTGGEPDMKMEDFLRVPFSNQSALLSLGSGLIGNKIISGCNATIGGGGEISVTEGYISLNGEIMKVEAQTVPNTLGFWRYEKATSYDSDGDKTFINGIFRQTFRDVRGIVTSVASLSDTDLDCQNGPRMLYEFSGELGAWDMSSDTTLTILKPSYISSFDKIVQLNAMIINDPGNLITDLTASGYVQANATQLVFTQIAGFFDIGINYNSTGISRGYYFGKYIG